MALRTLLAGGGVSRTVLAEQLGLSQMAVSRIARELMEIGLVEESGIVVRENGPGRRQTQLKIRDSGAYAAGIAVSAYSTELSIVDASGKIAAHRVIQVEDINDGEAAAKTLAHGLNAFIKELHISRSRIVGLGVAAAADLDENNIHVLSAGYLDWKPFNLVETISNITGLFVRAENITDALTLAETSVGSAKDMSDVIVLRVATSIGGALMQHGQIVRGHGRRAGRFGHFNYCSTDLTCACGGHDCINCSASGWSVLARLGLIDDKIYRSERVREYADAIGRFADHQNEGKSADDLTRALKDAGGALARALELLDQALAPQAFILAGSLSRVPAYLLGLKDALHLASGGNEILTKLIIGEIRASRAAAIHVLLERIYSPAFDFEALRTVNEDTSGAVPSATRVR